MISRSGRSSISAQSLMISGMWRFLGDALGRFKTGIADGHNLDIGQREQTGQMALTHNSASPDNSDSQFLCWMLAHTNTSNEADGVTVQPRSFR